MSKLFDVCKHILGGDVLFRAKFCQYYGLNFDFDQDQLSEEFFQKKISKMFDADLQDFYLEFKRVLQANKDNFVIRYATVLKNLLEAEMLKRCNDIRKAWILKLEIAKTQNNAKNKVPFGEFVAIEVLDHDIIWPIVLGYDKECECENVMDFVIHLRSEGKELVFPQCRTRMGKYTPLDEATIESTLRKLLSPTDSFEEFLLGERSVREPRDVTGTPLNTLAVWCYRHQLFC